MQLGAEVTNHLVAEQDTCRQSGQLCLEGSHIRGCLLVCNGPRVFNHVTQSLNRRKLVRHCGRFDL